MQTGRSTDNNLIGLVKIIDSTTINQEVTVMPEEKRSNSGALLNLASRQASAGSMLMPQAYNSLFLEQRLVVVSQITLLD